ncbi:MAG: DUF488 family protein [Candidatus Microsaccharimonas sp.]
MQTLFTIGHSTREIDEFIDLLKAHAITTLVDIRTIPKSRHNPQYGQEELEGSLREHGIEYAYIKSLGGLRPVSKHSINDAWRNKSFRNYADYMQTDDFKQGLRELLKLSQDATVAIMCAETVPWRCHRSLVADALLVRGVPVCEIISEGNEREHKLTPFAVVQGSEITYPKSALES